MPRLILLLFTIHFSLFTSLSQDISFYKENITMKIEKDYFYVTGSYYLRTTGDKSITLVYPFPADSIYGLADSVLIYNLSADTTVSILNRIPNSLVFKADFGDSPELVILISYRQKLLGNRAEYILESTKGWRKPFEQADYQLIVPVDLEVHSFSMPPDESIINGEETIYYWVKRNFMPSVNMIFEFSREY